MAKTLRFISRYLPATWCRYLPLEVPRDARTLDFNPCEVAGILTAPAYKKRPRRGLWLGEGWTKSVVPIRPDYIHPTIDAICRRGLPYMETAQYQTMRQGVDSFLAGEVESPSRAGAYWCRSYQDIDKYFEILIASFEDIRRSGYKSQAELMTQNPGVVRHAADELKIAIAPDGSPVFVGTGGNHRFSIVRHLGITRVSGLLVGVDESWAREHVVLQGQGSSAAYEAVRKAAEKSLEEGRPTAGG